MDGQMEGKQSNDRDEGEQMKSGDEGHGIVEETITLICILQFSIRFNGKHY